MAYAVSGVDVTPSSAPAPRRFSAPMRKLTVLLTAFVMSVAFVAVEAPTEVEAASHTSMVMYDTYNQLGKRYSWGATGMRRYDCSGLVYRMFEMNGLLRKIGGGRKTAKGYLRWFRDRGLASKYNPRKGDLVVWGRGGHIGIYIGDGKAISALTSGVSRHGVRAINLGFTAYLHTRLN